MDNHTIIPFKCEPGGSCDLTLKQNVHSIDEGLSKVLALRPVTWQWKDKRRDGENLQYGFIAQEVEAVIPDLVSEQPWEGDSKKKFLTTSGMIPYLVAALQEQQAQITQLQKKLKKLGLT